MSRNAEQKQVLSVLVPPAINIRLDEAVLQRRKDTGRRVSRAELVVAILDRELPGRRAGVRKEMRTAR